MLLADVYKKYQQFGHVRVIESKANLITSTDELKLRYPFLYPFQAEAAVAAINRGSFLFAFDMGLGKTITGAVTALELSQGKHPILIICPASVQRQWQSELKKWFNRSATIITGSKKKRARLWVELTDPAHLSDPIYIISYESLRMDWDDIDVSGHVVVADELSKIKNHSKIFKVFQAMSKVVKYRVGLSGTPISGKLEHYRNLMAWINPGWMTWKFFDETYTVKNWITVTGGEKKLVTIGYRNVDDFVKRLVGYVDRKTKDDIGIQLPPRTVEWRYIPMDKYQIKAHEAFISYAKEKGQGILPVWRMLQTVADGTEITLESESELIDEAGIAPDAVESPKLGEIDALIEEIGDEKILIFTGFARFARRIQTHLNKRANTKVAYLATGEDVKEKEASVEAFRNNPACKYLVCTDTLAFGVDFPYINYEIQADVPTDISIFQQRCERIHRINSPVDKPKTVIMLYSQGIEEEVYLILQKKAELNEAVTEGKALMPNINIRDEVARKYGLL